MPIRIVLVYLDPCASVPRVKMFRKPSLLAMMLLGAVGIPYLSTSSGSLWNKVSGLWRSSPGEKAATPGAVQLAPSKADQPRPAEAAKHAVAVQPITSPGSTIAQLTEVLRFDISPGWVMSRWPRVSAGLAELDQQGYRVPLVTGTGQDDLAGSLTYYFSKQQQLEQIVFHGSTGDPRKLVALVTSQYKFRHQPTDDPALYLYQVRWNGKPWSELRIRPARVLRADVPHSRFEVDLAMKRP